MAATQQPGRNPFGITKSNDFDDADIAKTFVNLPTSGGWRSIIQPREPLPLLLLGGKGVGRTHLMRYLSAPVRTLNSSPLQQVRKDGFLGIYFRAGGLNASRFTGKGEDPDRWDAIFTYYMDLWLGQVTLSTLELLLRDVPDREELELHLVQAVVSLFDAGMPEETSTLRDLNEAFHALQRQLDVQVNNVVLSEGHLEAAILVTPGRLVFGIPQAAAELIPALEDVRFLYLVDEFENLDADHQKYVNSLIREREPPVSFRVGARLYGFRTAATYSAGEENRDGSEYKTVYLDGLYRQHSKEFAKFCDDIVSRRLQGDVPQDDDPNRLSSVARLFEEFPKSEFSTAETRFIVDNYPPLHRPYQNALRRKLTDAAGLNLSPADIEQIVELLSVPDLPLLEKANCFLLYQDWSRGRRLPESAAQIQEDGARFRDTRTGRHARVLSHFAEDLIAQMLREARRPQRYLGFKAFVLMSTSHPRNLMTILKNVYDWAVWQGEDPFRQPISIEAQQLGVVDAARWFYDDAQVLGDRGPEVHDCIRRLGNLLSEMRFSDKPVESSLVTFSVDLDGISSRARENLDLARKWSLLVDIPAGQRHRNEPRVDAKFQLSRMLAPLWDLPLARRGATPLQPAECNAIFDPEHAADYDDIVARRLRRMNAPFGRPPQSALPGV